MKENRLTVVEGGKAVHKVITWIYLLGHEWIEFTFYLDRRAAADFSSMLTFDDWPSNEASGQGYHQQGIE